MPVGTQAKLSTNDGPPVTDATYYRSLIGALQYLTFSRTDIAYTVQQVCLHMHTSREPHLTALKRTLRYPRGSLDYDLLLRPSPTSELMVYTNADWVGCPDMRRSTSCYVVFLGGQPHLLGHQAVACHLPLQRGDLVPRYGQRRGRGNGVRTLSFSVAEVKYHVVVSRFFVSNSLGFLISFGFHSLFLVREWG
jgi:hypothetical protein